MADRPLDAVAQPTKQRRKRDFPRIFREGSVVVKVYRVNHKRTGAIYAVAWHDGGGRKLKQFADLGKAEDEARLKAGQLASGRVDAAGMSIADLEKLKKAAELAGDVPVVAAMEEWRAARNLVGGDILAACKSWADRHAVGLPKATVQEVVKKIIDEKRKLGRKVECSLEPVLMAFSSDFPGVQFSSISPKALSEWLDKCKHPGTRNSHRKRLVTLWRWGRDEGFLPQDVKTAAEKTKIATEDEMTIGIATPETLRSLMDIISSEHSHYVPALTIAADCGLRRSEIHAQDWKDIDLDRKLLVVTKVKRNTPARRPVPLTHGAVARLLPFKKSAGSICANLAIDRIRDIGITAGLDLPDNCFRHTRISARLAILGDVGKVAYESGNTPDVVFKHYREVLAPDRAQLWFDAVAPEGETEQDRKDYEAAMREATKESYDGIVAREQATMLMDALESEARRRGLSQVVELDALAALVGKVASRGALPGASAPAASNVDPSSPT